MRIKQLPEDFVVEEIASHALDDGPYTLVEVRKHDMTTEHAASEIARQLGIPRRSVAYAGTKDKRAVTTQYMTVRAGSVRNFSHKDIQLTALGTRKEQLSLGMLSQNHFTITCRKLRAERLCELAAVPNYFDEQRFSRANARIGRHLIRKEFEKAAMLVFQHDREHGPSVKKHVAERPNDFVGALRLLPRQTLLMFVHAFQSEVFNEVLRRYVEREDPNAVRIEGPVRLVVPSKKIPGTKLPLVGFDTRLDGDTGTWCKAALDGVILRDFVIREIPHLTLEGTSRDALLIVNGLEVGGRAPDDLNPGYEKQTLSFTLQKGAYATIVLKCLFRTGRIIE